MLKSLDESEAHRGLQTCRQASHILTTCRSDGVSDAGPSSPLRSSAMPRTRLLYRGTARGGIASTASASLLLASNEAPWVSMYRAAR